MTLWRLRRLRSCGGGEGVADLAQWEGTVPSRGKVRESDAPPNKTEAKPRPPLLGLANPAPDVGYG